MAEYKRREFVRWKRKYLKYDLQGIDNGQFWKDILDLEDEGERLHKEARDIESKDITKSCEVLVESASRYSEIQKKIDDKRKYVVRAKFRYRRVTVLNQLIGFLLGVAASILAAAIWENIIK